MRNYLIAGLIAVGLAGAANAQSVDARHYDQQSRIHQGERSGQLTYGEAHRLERQQHSIDRQEARMRYRDGGHLTGHDRAVLQTRENRASAHIYRAKHNWRSY